MNTLEVWPPRQHELKDPREGFTEAWFLKEETRERIRREIRDDYEKEINKHLLDQ